MKNLLEVREFETITCNKYYQNDESYKYINKETFDELESFVLELNECGDSDTNFLNIGLKRNVGKVIQAKNFVGLIQMKNGFQIQVLPKISYSGIEESKKIFLGMLRSLKDFPSKVCNESNLKVDRMNLYEIFINMYIQEIRKLVKKGLRASYFSENDNLNYYKGKLLVSQNISRNFMHKERFFVSYDEFGTNRPENKLIKSTLVKLQKISNSVENVKEIRQLLVYFEMVDMSNNYAKDIAKITIDRNTRDYEIPLRWSKIFLMNKSFTTFSGNTASRSLLFPMEKVFEAYVAKNLRKTLSDLDWDISIQDKGFYLFDSPKQFALRPDIVITRENGSRIILDTKWKSLVKTPQKNYGISQADMYQMYAYSKKYDTPEIWLLYPMNEEMQSACDIQFESADNVLVRLFFVDVSRIEESLEELKCKLQYHSGTADNKVATFG